MMMRGVCILAAVAAAVTPAAAFGPTIANASAVFLACPNMMNQTSCDASPGCSWSGTYCQPNGWFSGLGSNSSTINTTLGALNSDGTRYSLLATIGPYPGATPSTAQTTVTQYFGWAVVNALPNASYITVIYNLTNMPPSSSGGLHVHTGTTCSVSSMVGGHYWAPASSPDPWNSNTMWTSDASGNAVGSFNVTSGYQYAANLHHAMVVHLPNGTRFGCGVLDSYINEVVELDALATDWVMPCHGANGIYRRNWFNMSAVNATTSSLGYWSYASFVYTDPTCNTTAIFNISVSGLFVVEQTAMNRGPGAADITFFNGTNYNNPIDVTVITLQYPFLYLGANIANESQLFNLDPNRRPLNWAGPFVPTAVIGTLQSSTTPESINGIWGGDCVYNMPYNFTSGTSSGYVREYYQFTQIPTASGALQSMWQGQLHFWFTSSTCSGNPDYIANIPWSRVNFTGPSMAVPYAVESTFEFPAFGGLDNGGVAYGLVARAGARLSFGAAAINGSIPSTPSARATALGPFLSRVPSVPVYSGLISGDGNGAFNNATPFEASTLVATMYNYPSATVMANVSYFGWIAVFAEPTATNITVFYNLSSLPPLASGGIHIHAGTTCGTASLVGGHYWTPPSSPDPWNTTWTTDASGNAVGNFTISTGYQFAGNLGHAVVLHLPNGTRFSCGILQSVEVESLEMDSLVGSWRTSPCTANSAPSPRFPFPAYSAVVNFTAVNLTYGSYTRSFTVYNDAGCTSVNLTSQINGMVYTAGPLANRGAGAFGIDFTVNQSSLNASLTGNQTYPPAIFDSVTVQYPYIFFGSIGHSSSGSLSSFTPTHRPVEWGPPMLSGSFPPSLAAPTSLAQMDGIWGGQCVVSCPCNLTNGTTSGYWNPTIQFDTSLPTPLWRGLFVWYSDAACSTEPVYVMESPWAPFNVTGTSTVIPNALNTTFTTPDGLNVYDLVMVAGQSLAFGFRNYVAGQPSTPADRPDTLAPFLSRLTTFPTLAQNTSTDVELLGTGYYMSAIVGAYPGTAPAVPYFGYAVVQAPPQASNITVSYNFTNLEPSVTGGFHIHAGTSCTDASLVGGHYWTPTSSPDPWNAATYTTDASGNASGTITLATGYQYLGNLGHAFVIHAANGSRVGCGTLTIAGGPPAAAVTVTATGAGVPLPLAATVSAYPGMAPQLQPAAGSITVRAGAAYQPLVVTYNLTGLPANAVGGVHVHAGFGPGVCSNASLVGGHYWYAPTVPADPWNTTWSSDASGSAVGSFTLATGYGYAGNEMHAVVVHDPSGARIGCGVLQGTISLAAAVVYDVPPLQTNQTFCGVPNLAFNASVTYLDPAAPRGNAVTTAQTWARPTLSVYPADSSKLYTIHLEDQGAPGNQANFVHWLVVNVPGLDLEGGVYAQGAVIAPYVSPANPNALPRKYVFHVFEQTLPVDPAQFNITTPTQRATFDFSGFLMATQMGPEVAMNYGLVYTSLYSTYTFNTLLSPMYGFPPVRCPADQMATMVTSALDANLPLPLLATMGTYPGYAGVAVSGEVFVTASQGGYGSMITLDVHLSGLTPNSTGGLHIHTGTTCSTASLVGGHYWTPASAPDPWNAVMWTSDGSGNAEAVTTVMSGYGYTANLGHAVVVHDATGTRIGCGLLQSSLSTQPQVAFASPAPRTFPACNTSLVAPASTVALFSPWAGSPYQAPNNNRMTVAQARTPPSIAFVGDPTTLYTVMMVDEVVAATGQPGLVGNYLHWLVVNVDGATAATGIGSGDVVAGYFPPANPDAMPHSYAIYVVAQEEGHVDPASLSMYQNNRAFFDPVELKHAVHLGATVGVTFAQIFTDLAANYWFDTFGMPLQCPAAALAAATTTAADWLVLDVPPTARWLARTVWSTPASNLSACGTSYPAPRTVSTVNPAMGRNGASVTSAATATMPLVYFPGNPTATYAAAIVDLDFGVLHYFGVNIPGTMATTGVVGGGDTVVGYFPLVNPDTFPHSYAVYVWPQPAGPTVNASAALATVLAQPGASLLNASATPLGAVAVGNFTPTAVAATTAALGFGPTVAYSWANVFTSPLSLAAFNVFGLGATFGTISCPAAVTQATAANASWAGVAMPSPTTAAGLTAPLDVTFYTPATLTRTRSGNLSTPYAVSAVYNGPPGTFAGVATVPASAGWGLPVVAAPYVSTAANYTLLMVRQPAAAAAMTMMGSMSNSMNGMGMSTGTNATVLWAVVNIPGAALPTGKIALGTTVWPYAGAAGAPGVVSTWLFPQTTQGPADTTGIAVSPMGVTANLTAFAAARNLGPATALSFFSSVPQGVTTACAAADGVTLTQDGRCVTDCVALLRMRRACPACGTVAVAARLGALPSTPAGANTAQLSASVATAAAAFLGVAPGSLAVSVTSAGDVTIVLAAALSQPLTQAVAQGQLAIAVDSVMVPLIAAGSLAPSPAGGVTAAPSTPGVTGAPTTTEPTSLAPTTLQPTTLSPTSHAPTSLAPTLIAGQPTTFAPTTQAPTTEAPVTEAPTTEAPVTEAPTSRAPSLPQGTGAPSSAPTPSAVPAGASSGGGGLSSGAVAAVVIVVLLLLAVAVYVVLVVLGKVAKPFGGSGGPSASNPYGAPPEFHSKANVVSNPTYEQGLPAKVQAESLA